MESRRWRLLLAALAAAALAPSAGAQAQSCTHFVAPPPAGSDANPGSSAQPWATLDHASARVKALNADGATVCFRNGVYTGGNSLYERFTVPTVFRAENAYRAVLQNNSRVISLFGGRNMVFRGFEFRHSGAGAEPLVVQVQQDGGTGNWAENVVFRDNVFHDSWNNDILKINNGARFVRVEGNVFYNQGPGTISGDEHMDVNSVTDVAIEDNIFFNDFAGSGRPNLNDTSSFIVIKDSNADDDGQIGSVRIAVRRNVFLNWQGGGGSNFLLLGEDGQSFFEARDVVIENNLMLGNAPNDMRANFGAKGAQGVLFRHNTVAGDLPSLAYAMRVNREGSNPVNQDLSFLNNIWSDPTGTMGAEQAGGTNEFADGDPSEAANLRLDRNLYWNGGQPIPPGDLVSPLVHDARRIVANPALPAQVAIVLPRWNGSAFPSGSATIRQEFERLVGLYGALPGGSPAIDQADAGAAPADDILGRPRTAGTGPDLGAWEAGVAAAAALTPSSGPAAGGERLTLTGGPFQAATTVTVGGQPATDVFFGSSTFLKATAPALAPGTLNDVVLASPAATLPAAYLADFLDVPRAHTFHRFVERMVRRALTGGCGGGNYCPDATVSREQMAVFLLRAREGPAYQPPACVTPTFSDVPCSSPFARWIEELARRGVTSGCGTGIFCPTSAVTREQMSVFLLRTLLGSAYNPPACTAATFNDVPCSSPFARWIYDLVARGITSGCGGGAYCPAQPTSRGQMSVFLVATFAF
jgi:hypothetical protein